MADSGAAISRAAEILRTGGLVAFPTETVYGLGADARNSAAIQKIFAAKGRPATNPLIVHVANADIAQRYVTSWPTAAQRLAEIFWPGPITFVLPKANEIVAEVTANQPTVAIRAPDHVLTQRLLKEFDGPVAAPSANRSMRVSPTTADHVRHELGEKVDLILDGGPCHVGIESTVLDLTQTKPVILRPGGIPRRRIEELIGPVGLASENADPSLPAASPGMHETHYAPATPAFRFEPKEIEKVAQYCQQQPPQSVAVLAISDGPDLPRLRELGPIITLIEMPDSPDSYARRLYATLHDVDALRLQSIWIEQPPDIPAWHAVRDRIRRATKAAGLA